MILFFWPFFCRFFARVFIHWFFFSLAVIELDSAFFFSTSSFASFSIIHSIDSDEKRIVATSVNYVLSRCMLLFFCLLFSRVYALKMVANEFGREEKGAKKESAQKAREDERQRENFILRLMVRIHLIGAQTLIIVNNEISI